MWFSPILLEEFVRDRSRELSDQLDRSLLAQEYSRRQRRTEKRPRRWRTYAAQRLAAISLRLDHTAAQAALKSGLLFR